MVISKEEKEIAQQMENLWLIPKIQPKSHENGALQLAHCLYWLVALLGISQRFLQSSTIRMERNNEGALHIVSTIARTTEN